MEKPGWKTTEFWVTTVMLVTVLAGGSGLIPAGDVEQVKTEASGIVQNVAAALVGIAYIIGRVKVKAASAQ